MSRFRRMTALLIASLALARLVACGDEDDGPAGPAGDTNPILGAWTATSFSIDGTDYTVQGLSVTITFTETTYTIDVTDDANHVLCESPATACSNGGAIALTDTTVTFDPGAPDEVVFSYTISGNVLTLSGGIGLATVTATLVR